jgi:RimJ/RimL family protein N-acetyltransferase
VNRHGANKQLWSLETSRLKIRRATPNEADVALLLELWTCPDVMKNVGFPKGLKTDGGKIESQLRNQAEGEYDCVLIAAVKSSGERIGECKLGYPDTAGIAHTDIKLLPAHWGRGYGREIKRALLDYLFFNTPCRQVRATPNVSNLASIKMQKAVGGRKTGESIYRFPESMSDYTTDVHCMEFTVFREDWLNK